MVSSPGLVFGPLSRIVGPGDPFQMAELTPWKKKMRVILTTGSNWDDPPSRYLKKIRQKRHCWNFPGHHQRDKISMAHCYHCI